MPSLPRAAMLAGSTSLHYTDGEFMSILLLISKKSLLDLSLRAWTSVERMARFGRKEGLNHWLTLESCHGH
jgi:hypothetical protein